MRVFVLVFLVLFFLGCSKKDNSEVSQQYDAYLWHLFFTDNDFSTSYGIDKDANINIKKAWEISKGVGVKVAIIDESFEPTHEDISANVVLTYNVNDGSADVTGSGTSHGNTCSGHVGAMDNSVGIIGSAPEAKLVLIKYGNSDADDIHAFDKALREGVKVISCSWGSYNISQPLANKLKEVYAAGITVVFASGNDGKSLDGNDNDESESPYVIGIGASCENNDVCGYSNYGVNIDLLAPGGEHSGSIGLLGLNNMGNAGKTNQKNLVNNNYNFDSGTSYSTPLVAGVVALMYSVKPDITPKEVREILIQSAQKIGIGVDYDSNGFNEKRAYGKIDAYEALKLVQNQP